MKESRNTGMKIVNFGDPLTEEHIRQIEDLVGTPVECVLPVPVHIDWKKNIYQQVCSLVRSVEWTSDEWMGDVIINPPSHALVAIMLASVLRRFCGGGLIAFLCFTPREDDSSILDVMDISLL
jgi:hypothetical protein